MKPFFDGYAHRPPVRRALLPLASGPVLQTQGPESVKYVMFWGVRDTILVTSDCFSTVLDTQSGIVWDTSLLLLDCQVLSEEPKSGVYLST